jgi:hypothetical protein
VIEVQDFVIECLERALGQRDQPHRQVETREPGRGFAHMRYMLEVEPDVLAFADSTHGRDQADRRVRLAHRVLLISRILLRSR